MTSAARETLKKRRIEKGYKTAEGFSREIGISFSHYSKIEKGNRNPSLSLSNKIANTLDSDVQTLFLERINGHKYYMFSRFKASTNQAPTKHSSTAMPQN